MRRVYVHIGPPKTGTTFLQNVLWGNRAALCERGVLVPCEDWSAQRRCVAQLLRRDPNLPARPAADGSRDAWDRLLLEADASEAHTVLLSAERLSRAEAHDVRALVESFAPATVHVVLAARDLGQLITAGWQTHLRNRRAPSWQQYLASVRDPGGPDTYGGAFWRKQDPVASLPPYLEHVPAQRIHVVTVPPAGARPSQLWERFCAVTGLEAERYDLDVPRANVSLGGVEAEVLRRLTARTADELSVAAFGNLVKHYVARDILESREQSFRLVLPEREHEWLDPRAQEAIDYLRTGGFDVVGDLDELVPVRAPEAREPDDVSDGDVLALMDEALGATVLEMARREARRSG